MFLYNTRFVVGINYEYRKRLNHRRELDNQLLVCTGNQNTLILGECMVGLAKDHLNNNHYVYFQ